MNTYFCVLYFVACRNKNYLEYID